jgi:hypothetical protein
MQGASTSRRALVAAVASRETAFQPLSAAADGAGVGAEAELARLGP